MHQPHKSVWTAVHWTHWPHSICSIQIKLPGVNSRTKLQMLLIKVQMTKWHKASGKRKWINMNPDSHTHTLSLSHTPGGWGLNICSLYLLAVQHYWVCGLMLHRLFKKSGETSADRQVKAPPVQPGLLDQSGEAAQMLCNQRPAGRYVADRPIHGSDSSQERSQHRGERREERRTKAAETAAL